LIDLGEMQELCKLFSITQYSPVHGRLNLVCINTRAVTRTADSQVVFSCVRVERISRSLQTCSHAVKSCNNAAEFLFVYCKQCRLSVKNHETCSSSNVGLLRKIITGTFFYLFIHSSVICHTTRPQPLPKRFLRLMRFRASSFK
jgi:hypothetical protein